MFNIFDWLKTSLCRFCIVISALTLVVIVLLNCCNLLARWIYKSPFDWTLEISLILFVYTVCFIVPILYNENKFIQMHLIEELMSERKKAILGIFVDVAVISFFLYLIPVSFKLSINQIDLLSRGLGIPRIYVTMPVPIISLFIILIGAVKIRKAVKTLK